VPASNVKSNKNNKTLNILLRAYLSCISDSDSTSLERIYYYIRYTRETSISSIIFNILDKQVLQATIFAIFDKQAKQTISIFLICKN